MKTYYICKYSTNTNTYTDERKNTEEATNYYVGFANSIFVFFFVYPALWRSSFCKISFTDTVCIGIAHSCYCFIHTIQKISAEEKRFLKTSLFPPLPNFKFGHLSFSTLAKYLPVKTIVFWKYKARNSSITIIAKNFYRRLVYKDLHPYDASV